MSGQKILVTIFVVKTGRKSNKIFTGQDSKRQIYHGQTELNNILVNKSVLNEINKEGILTQGFKDWIKIKRKVSQNLHDLQNLLIKLTVKVSAGKAWLLYVFPFNLNPGDKKILARKFVSMKTLRNTLAKLTFIVLPFNVTFIDKSYGDTKRRCVI